MRILRFLILICCALCLASCASDKTIEDPGAAFKGQSSEQIFTLGVQQLMDHDYDKASKTFEGLDALYPFSDQTQKGQLYIIYAYYENNDVPSTLAAADRYIQLYPLGPHTDYAYYMRGLAEFYQNTGFLEHYFRTDYSQRSLQPLQKAFADFNELVHRFPESAYSPDARQRMIFIRDTIAQYNAELAEFYYEHESYIGAANRATLVIHSFQGTPSVRDALIVLVKSDFKLGLPDQANQAYQILQLNYSDVPSLASLQKG